MVACALRSCTSRDSVNTKKSSGITYHRFPKTPSIRDMWVQFVKRGSWQLTKYSVLCSKHFAEEHFDRTSSCLIRLRKDAIPTIGVIEIETPSDGHSTPKSFHGLLLESSQAPSTSSGVKQSGKMAVDVTVTPRKQKILKKLDRALSLSSDRRRKLSLLQRRFARREKKIATMKNILKELSNKRLIQEEAIDVISILGGPQELFLRQYKKNQKKPLPQKNSENIKTFALTLHYYSPSAYNYVRKTFNTCLPHTRTLSRSYQNVNGEPGFTSEAFEVLQVLAKSKDSEIFCSLIIDEMSIRQQEEWWPKQNKCYGYVYMGTGSNENSLAKDALVFLLNAVNGSWKIPVAYFLVNGLTGEQKKGLVYQCLLKTHEAGINVVSVTFVINANIKK